MSQLTFERCIFWFTVGSLLLSITQEPLWPVVVNAALAGLWDWVIEGRKRKAAEEKENGKPGV